MSTQIPEPFMATSIAARRALDLIEENFERFKRIADVGDTTPMFDELTTIFRSQLENTVGFLGELAAQALTRPNGNFYARCVFNCWKLFVMSLPIDTIKHMTSQLREFNQLHKAFHQ